MIEDRVSKFLKRSASKLYHMYKEIQELLDEYKYLRRQATLIDLNDDSYTQMKPIIKRKKIKKLVKKAEGLKNKVKTEQLFELSDSEESIKKEHIKDEGPKWYNEAEYTLFDRKPLPIKDEHDYDVMGEYTKANTGMNYNQGIDYSHAFSLPVTIPSNAVEYIDLDK